MHRMLDQALRCLRGPQCISELSYCLMVRVAEERGLQVFKQLSDVPGCAAVAEPHV
jgi:hypothetical protein